MVTKIIDPIYVIYEGRKTEPSYFQKFSGLLEKTNKVFREIPKKNMDENCTIRRDLIDLAYAYKIAVTKNELTVFSYITNNLDVMWKYVHNLHRDNIQGYRDCFDKYAEYLIRQAKMFRDKGERKSFCQNVEDEKYSELFRDELYTLRRTIFESFKEKCADASSITINKLTDSQKIELDSLISRKCALLIANMGLYGKIVFPTDILHPNLNAEDKVNVMESPRFAVMVDRDKPPKKSTDGEGELWYEDRSDVEYLKHLDYAKQFDIDFVITTPLFEFWLLLHYAKSAEIDLNRYSADLTKETKNTLYEDLKNLDFSVMDPNYQSEIEHEYEKLLKRGHGHAKIENARDNVMKRNVPKRFGPCYLPRILDAIDASQEVKQKPKELVTEKGTFIAAWIKDVLAPSELQDIFTFSQEGCE